MLHVSLQCYASEELGRIGVVIFSFRKVLLFNVLPMITEVSCLLHNQHQVKIVRFTVKVFLCGWTALFVENQ